MKKTSGFDKADLRGITLLLLILGLLLFYRHYFLHRATEKQLESAALFEKEIKDFERSAKPLRKEQKKVFRSVEQNAPEKIPVTKRGGRREMIRKKQEDFVIEINSATRKEFEKLKGIGEKLSERIVKYRQKLGGFCSVEQIKEVYGIKPEVYESIKVHLKCNGTVKKLNVNSTTFKDLVHHPYLNYEEVKKIFRYKDKNGNIGSMEVLDSILGTRKFNKVKAYLTIE